MLFRAYYSQNYAGIIRPTLTPTQGGEILGVISRRRVERFLDAGTGGEISLDAGSRDFFLSTQGRKISQCRRKEETLMQLERISC